MKIALTGHTRGIGQALADMLRLDGHDVLGFSRSNGYDLINKALRKQVLDLARDCDIFINNAFLQPNQAQKTASWIPIEMLYEVHRAWRGQEHKTVIVIGSETQNQPMVTDHPYQIHKMALTQACRQLRSVARYPRIIQVNPGATDTDQIKHRDWIKMDAQEVAQVVKYCIDSLDHIYVNEITFTPGRRYQ